ncbi:unnamed protein product [Periconia digitata]|uniref:Uncharacterized protein n=1 Tax=Periconia digitata TaxID=1303443 RepID=A0A9W4XXF3_9PLEO|nr:unnamed protein product [Periconia digitata]
MRPHSTHENDTVDSMDNITNEPPLQDQVAEAMDIDSKVIETEEDSIERLDKVSKEQWQTKLRIAIPPVKTLAIEQYYKDPHIYVPEIPEDLKLARFFDLYNHISRRNFKAIPKKSETEDEKEDAFDFLINRAIFYYGVDNRHSFSSHSSRTRYNIFLMAFVMAYDFDRQYCEPECESFVYAYMEAWLEGLVTHPDPGKHSFQKREEFLSLWANPESADRDFDLITFSGPMAKNMHLVIKVLYKKKDEIPAFPEESDIIDKCLRGEFTKSELKAYAPRVALRYLITLMKEAKDQLQEINQYHQGVSASAKDEKINLADVQWQSEVRKIAYAQTLLVCDITYNEAIANDQYRSLHRFDKPYPRPQRKR